MSIKQKLRKKENKLKSKISGINYVLKRLENF